jgi:transcriptional regulator with PAS, ATPase and Fis domain
VARGLHALSPRSAAAFRGLNCAALADELVDAELFGHARGAFTGAVAGRAGLIEEASGGTLFLDEIAELSLRAQAKLLRAFQEQEVRRVGEGRTRPVDVRFVAACNRSLDLEAAADAFRADLLYRLAVIRIHVPPLRTRPGDIRLIVEACWPALAAQAGTTAVLASDVLTALERHAWPGNVRELQHVLATLAVHAPATGTVGVDVLPDGIRSAPGTLLPFAEARGRFERDYVRAALERNGASPTRAARAIGLSRQGLRKVLTRTGGASHGHEPEDERPVHSIE